MKKRFFSLEEARRVGEQLGVDWSNFDVEQFRKGMDVELEHGLINEETNVTNDNSLLTGKIALAHLYELPDYYDRLDKMEHGVEPVDKNHYYGDTVRKLFIFAAFVMAVSLPLIYDTLNLPWFLMFASIVVLIILAGAVSPRKKLIIKINAIAAVVAFLTFLFYAIEAYGDFRAFSFVVNQMLTLVFLITVYFAVKSWRGLS